MKKTHASDSFANLVSKAAEKQTQDLATQMSNKILNEQVYPILQQNLQKQMSIINEMAKRVKVMESVMCDKLKISMEDYVAFTEEVEDALLKVKKLSNEVTHQVQINDVVRFTMKTTDPQGVVSGPVKDKYDFVGQNEEMNFIEKNLLNMCVNEIKTIEEAGYTVELQVQSISRMQNENI